MSGWKPCAVPTNDLDFSWPVKWVANSQWFWNFHNFVQIVYHRIFVWFIYCLLLCILWFANLAKWFLRIATSVWDHQACGVLQRNLCEPPAVGGEAGLPRSRRSGANSYGLLMGTIDGYHWWVLARSWTHGPMDFNGLKYHEVSGSRWPSHPASMWTISPTWKCRLLQRDT